MNTMKRYLITGMILVSGTVFAQDSTKEQNNKTIISGSVDAYYRFNFANPKSGNTNNLTSFTNSQNSFELGMASIRADHSFGKASAVADLGFGRRADEFSYNDGAANGFISLANVKQLFVSYAVSDKFKLTLGKWGTHIGYEVVDAYLNRNYSMSYMFSYGPFFHTGLKADVSLGGKSALMVGIANPTDYSTTTSSAKFVIAQFSTASSNGAVKGYLNYQGGKYAQGSNLHQVDVVVTGTVTSKFSIGYNGTVQIRKPAGASGNSWWASALYLNVDPTSKFGLTLRSEYFDDKKGLLTNATGNPVLGMGNVFATTLSGNIKAGNLVIIPELRLDNASKDIFEKNEGNSTKSSFSGLLAVAYRF